MGKVISIVSIGSFLSEEEQAKVRDFGRLVYQEGKVSRHVAIGALMGAVIACKVVGFSLAQVVSFVHEEWKR